MAEEKNAKETEVELDTDGVNEENEVMLKKQKNLMKLFHKKVMLI